jgi:cyclopropane fatty-acyl-phospholipid synthase-like methyltransferase
MDRVRFSFLAHAGLDYCCPVGDATAEAAMRRLALRAGDKVVDIGAGKGAWSVRLAQLTGAVTDAIEPAPAFADAITTRADSAGVGQKITVIRQTVRDTFGVRIKRYDAALCIGSSHAFEALPAAASALRRLVRPGGRVLLGEGCWKKPPEAEYLAAFGGSADELLTHDANIALFRSAGYTVEDAVLSTQQEFDDYEDRYAEGIERFAREHPDDPDVPAMLEKSRRWHDAYRRWGRDTMGFALYFLVSP